MMMETNHKENSRRIAKNTVYLYIRMLFGMLVSLYTSRVVLNALGVEDYGIYNVVGGFVAMFSLISSSLSSSIGRFLTYELGLGNMERLKKVFSTSLLIQICISVIIVLVAETIGLWFINYKMVIPHERLYAANWVFQASILSFVLGLLSTPYSAAVIAHERMKAFAYIGILQIFSNLIIVLLIAYVPLGFDKLIVYAICLTLLGIVLQGIYLGYCLKNFEECRALPDFDKGYWKEMSGFAGWNTIGCTAGILKDQGINVLLNLFFGPVLNATRGIASSISGAVGSFSANFMTALNPQITKSYAQGDKAYLFSLVERGSRFGFYIMMALAIPLLLETSIVLRIWLGKYPEQTVLFARLVLLLSLIDILSSTLITLQVATGTIRNYQLAVGGLLIMNFPLSYTILKLGAPAFSVYIVAILIGMGCLALRLAFLKGMTGLSITDYFNNVILNVLVTATGSFIVPLIIYILLPEGVPRLIILFTLSLLCSALSILFIGCTRSERTFLVSKVISRCIKVKKAFVYD